VKSILWRGIALSTAGVLITTVGVGLFINWITGFSLIESLLIGSIVSSTDAAAVLAIFRSHGGKKLKNNIEPTLDLESGTNDPMAYFLTTTLIFLMLNPTTSIEANILLLIQSIGLGGILGVVFGKGMVKLINNINLHIPGLYPVLTIALAFLTFAVTYFVGGNGLLSVYIAALILNNDGFLHKKGSNAVLRWTSLVNADSDVFNPGTTGFPLPDYSNHRYRVCNLLLPYTGCQAPGCIPVSFTL
jgi:cell volume regulation protein A